MGGKRLSPTTLAAKLRSKQHIDDLVAGTRIILGKSIQANFIRQDKHVRLGLNKKAKSLYALYLEETLKRLLLFLILQVGLGDIARANCLRIASSANFTSSLKIILQDFKEIHNVCTSISSSSSGKLYHQIQNSAPFHIFLSANKEYPAKLLEQGYTTDIFPYAKGELILWNRSSKSNIQQIKDLEKMPGIKLAIANPRTAPYGTAAIEIIKAKLTRDRYQILKGENVGQALQYATADQDIFAFISKSQVLSLPSNFKGTFINLGKEGNNNLTQYAAIIRQKNMSHEQGLFKSFLLSKKVQEKLQSLGYRSIYASSSH